MTKAIRSQPSATTKKQFIRVNKLFQEDSAFHCNPRLHTYSNSTILYVPTYLWTRSATILRTLSSNAILLSGAS